MHVTAMTAALIVSVMGQLKTFGDEPFHKLDEKIVTALKATYPGAVLERDRYQKSMRVFARNLRDFTIYRLDKSGDWQKPGQTQGPDRGGISVRFYVGKGRWPGQMMVAPRGVTTTSNDLHVFKETTLVGNSEDGNWHLWAQIVTPKVDAPEAVATRLVEVFTAWEK